MNEQAALHDRVMRALSLMGGEPTVRVTGEFGALASIAARHAPIPGSPSPVPRCNTCVDPEDWDERPRPSPWPCADFRDVAAAVGVEVAP